MNRSILTGIAVAAFGLLTGCAGVNGTEVATFSAKLSGEFGDNGTHEADIAVLMNVLEGTFEGNIENFKFSQRGFDNPSGSIPISGTLSYNEDGNLKLEGTGEGTLSQAGNEYKANVKIASGWVHPRLDRVSMYYFGGGGMTQAGRWLDWTALRGSFKTDIDCKTGRFGSVQCELADLSLPKEERT